MTPDPEPGEILVDEAGNVVVGAPPAIAIVVTDQDEEE